MKKLIVLFLLSLSFSISAADGPSTTNNDDSCDVIVTPAATLLLPYFEVDLDRPTGETTLFTVTNTTQSPQIARVTIWTDRAYPLMSFNLFLTGYDAQSINLFDILARGRIAEPGTSSDSDTGRRSLDNDANDLLDLSECTRNPVRLPSGVLAELQSALREGRVSRCGGASVGNGHVHAVGYLTIDLVKNCGSRMPNEEGYFTGDLLFDNVLTGDYQQINSSQNFAQGGALVHIRAIAEGGAPGVGATNFGRTFYSILQDGDTVDRRQPLPSTFAARWISGGATGFATTYKIWREGVTRADAGCQVAPNARLGLTDAVRFDENENPTTVVDCQGTCLPTEPPFLPPTSRMSAADSLFFPPNPDGELAGWMYLNLDHGAGFPFKPFEVASQNWVIVSMAADGRYSADFDAASFGNGCTPTAAVTDEDGGTPAIAPAANVTRATFASGAPKTINNDDSCDVKVAPAATLLLPYFEIDLADPLGETTLFTVTNVTRSPQIARVTIWTDLAYPLLSFNLFLTGYDTQSINLYDVIVRGLVAPPGTSSHADTGRRSASNDANPLLDVTNCASLNASLPASLVEQLMRALTLGRTTSCGTARIGNTHTHAIGYATIDLVQNCGPTMPTDPGYFTTQLLYDNALIGDYQQVNSTNNFAQANAMVHIRAIPEGGGPGSALTTSFRRTFYSRLQGGETRDRRQPLPSVFSGHWISGGAAGFKTSFKIWREASTGANSGCNVSANGVIEVPDLVRFDEEENPTTMVDPCCCILCPPYTLSLPAVANVAASDYFFPPNVDGAVAGWLYLNLEDNSRTQSPHAIANQNWVIVSMAAEGRYSVDFDATAFGNGCTPGVQVTDEDGGPPSIGPAHNVNPDL